MNNEYERFVKSCERLDEKLHDKYFEMDGKGASDEELNALVDEMYVLRDILKEGKSDVVTADIKLKKFARQLSKKYELVLEADEKELKAVPIGLAEEKKPEEKPEKESEEKSNTGAVVAGILAASVATGALGYAIGTSIKNDKCKSEEATVETEETEVRTVTEEQTEEVTDEYFNLDSTIEPEKTVEETVTLVLGEYGTFLDATNDEQVEARAQYIIDNYYAPFMNKLSDYERSFITVENISNVIRVMAGELPLDSNGNKIMDANVVDYYGQLFTYLVGDLGSSPQLEGIYYDVPAYMFTVDGTELQAFVKRYDEDFAKMTQGFNTAAYQRYNEENIDGGVMVREAIASLGTKYWNEWCLQGMYGDTNPFNFSPKDRLFAFLACYARYGQWAFEYNMNAMQPVCIPACVNYSTKEMEDLNVNVIFWGYTTGEWDTIIAKAAGIETQPEPDSVAFTQDLMDELTWKYNNLNTMKLN